MKSLVLLVVLAAFSSSNDVSARKVANAGKCLSCMVKPVVSIMDRFLDYGPRWELGRSCDGRWTPCLHDLRLSLANLGAYLDGSCAYGDMRCDVHHILTTLRGSLQIHIKQSLPWGVSAGLCDHVGCLIDDTTLILRNLLGGLAVSPYTDCGAVRCRLRYAFKLLKTFCGLFHQLPPKPIEIVGRDNCEYYNGESWNCVLRRLHGLAEDSSLSVQQIGAKPEIPKSCAECIKEKGCDVCKKQFSCACGSAEPSSTTRPVKED